MLPGTRVVTCHHRNFSIRCCGCGRWHANSFSWRCHVVRMHICVHRVMCASRRSVARMRCIATTLPRRPHRQRLPRQQSHHLRLPSSTNARPGQAVLVIAQAMHLCMYRYHPQPAPRPPARTSDAPPRSFVPAPRRLSPQLQLTHTPPHRPALVGAPPPGPALRRRVGFRPHSRSC